jgi:predicted TIM-barrel fold metal-dependent hydrolase
MTGESASGAQNAFPAIDAHVHCQSWGYYPPRWHELSAKLWASRTVPPRDPADVLDRIEGGLVDPDGSILMNELDVAGIDACICLTLDWAVLVDDYSGASPAEMMRHYGELTEKHRGRFFAFAGVDPRRVDAVQLLEQSVKEWGMIGLKVYPPTGFTPCDPVLFPLYDKCVELGIPVAIHTAVVGHPLIGHYANPLYVAEVQLRYPELTLSLAHAGHNIWAHEAAMMASHHPHTYLEISMWYPDSKTDPGRVVRTLARMRDEVGAHKILFGSDHIGGPRFSGDRGIMIGWARFIRSLPEIAPEYGCSFTQEEIDLIMGGNAARIFALPVRPRPAATALEPEPTA